MVRKVEPLRRLRQLGRVRQPGRPSRPALGTPAAASAYLRENKCQSHLSQRLTRPIYLNISIVSEYLYTHLSHALRAYTVSLFPERGGARE
jgi:hypothetical protein